MAERYATTRVSEGGGQPEVLMVELERSELGRVLDLTLDPRWQQYLRTPQIPGRANTTPESLIRLANENYSRFFEDFIAQNKIRVQDYNVVIGPEFVRGGSQLCILHRDGQPSQLAIEIRARLQPALRPGAPRGTALPPVPGGRLAQLSRAQGIVGNQAAMALLGQLLGVAIQSIGDLGIQRRVQNELQTTHAQFIERTLSRGEGVLVVISMQEWSQADFNGMRARTLLSVSVESGPTQEAALRNWQSAPRLMPGPSQGWRAFEQYSWIDPLR